MRVYIYLNGGTTMYFDNVTKEHAENIENSLQGCDKGTLTFNDSTNNKKTVIPRRHVVAVTFEYKNV